MPLHPGLRIGAYEIQAVLGHGGMGEVYRARDTKLGRDVAIKVLPDSLLHDADRRARFEREARVLASLNHTNIAQVHGFEESEGVHGLVMELVDGPTLADRIGAGPVPVDEVLVIARQVAEALEAAHQQGVVHRDLKPANIKVRPDGVVKVLDFGLAKALEEGPPHPGAPESLITSPALTMMGVVLGTAAYMSPEQARGKPVDRRTDLWAFGCVLYEMLTGKRPFDGATLSDVIARILEREPDWTALPATTPTAVRALLRRCLQKEPKRRLDSAAVARMEIEEAAVALSAGVMTAAERTTRRWSLGGPMTAVVALVAALAGGTVAWFIPRSPSSDAPARVTRFVVDVRADGGVARPINNAPDVAVSPDSSLLVYSAGSQAQLMVRALDRLGGQPLAGATNARTPFLSPDGRWIGYFDQGGSLKKVALAGGPALVLCDTAGTSRGASWGADNTIVFATSDTATGLLTVPASGGRVTVLTSPVCQPSARPSPSSSGSVGQPVSTSPLARSPTWPKRRLLREPCCGSTAAAGRNRFRHRRLTMGA